MLEKLGKPQLRTVRAFRSGPSILGSHEEDVAWLVIYVAVELSTGGVAPIDDAEGEFEEACQQIEANSGRKPGKKEKPDLNEEIKAALLPQALPRQLATWVWLDPTTNRLMLDTSSMAVADDILTALVKLLDGFVAEPLNTQAFGASGGGACVPEERIELHQEDGRRWEQDAERDHPRPP